MRTSLHYITCIIKRLERCLLLLIGRNLDVIATKTSQKVYLSTTIVEIYVFLHQTFAFFVSQTVWDSVWDLENRVSEVQMCLHPPQHTCEPSDCAAVLSFNLDLVFISCFLDIWSGFVGLRFWKENCIFPLFYYILEEPSFHSSFHHLSSSTFAVQLGPLFFTASVGGGGFLKAEAINLQKKK